MEARRNHHIHLSRVVERVAAALEVSLSSVKRVSSMGPHTFPEDCCLFAYQKILLTTMIKELYLIEPRLEDI